MVDLRPDQLATVRAILQAKVPECEVWAFGSRAKWTAKDSSDLDLALVSSARLSQSTLGRLREAFTDSYLPIKVDVVDIHRVSDEFRKIIESQKVVLQKPSEAAASPKERAKWRTLPLEESVETIIDYRGKTPTKVSKGIPLITAKVVKNGRIETPDEFIAEEDYEGWMRRGIPRAGDVLLTMEAPLGEVAQLDERKVALAQRLVALRGKPGLLDNLFFKYLLQSAVVQEQLKSRASGTTVLGVKQSELRKINLTLPPLSEQIGIGEVLGVLDDKIELNRRMNETLEVLAKSLFKAWFVDSTQAALPKGWRTAKWGELVTLKYGKSLTDYDSDRGAYAVYGTNGRIGSHSSPLCNHAGIIIGRKGAYRGVHFCDSPFFVIDTAFYVEPKEQVELRWAYYELLRHDINSMDSGSAIPSTSREDFYNLPVLKPPLALQRRFVESLSPSWERQEHNRRESCTLAALRDALLPKLLSGELCVPAAASLEQARA